MRIILLLLLVSGALWTQTKTTEPASKNSAAPAGDAAKGKKLFASDGCYECHGYQGQGGSAGPRIAPNVLPYPAFSKYLRQPADQMPPYTVKVASDQDLADIYAFMRTIPQPPPVDSIPLLKK